MWGRNDFEDGLDIYKAVSSASSPGWVPGCESAWHGSTSISGSNRARRHSAASDSADTGIGTSCSDSVEDHSSSSGTLSFHPLRSQGIIPTAHVMPSPSSTKLGVTQSVPGSPWNSSQLSSPVSSPLDMKDPRPVRRWSSLTRLSGQEKSGKTSYQPDAHGSLDRSLLHARADASPLKPSTLDLSYSALPESRTSLAMPRAHSLGHQAVTGSPIQPSIRTQMWLSEQMEFRPDGMSTWQSEQQQRDRMRQEAELSQMLGGAALPVNTLVKIKEGLLRQRELEIDRQKQQILQLHARIRENELRAQQVLLNQRGRCDDSYALKSKESPMDSPTSSSLHSPQPPLCCENGELARRLASSELEVVHLKEFLKQNTQKYTEDIKKLEEKMKTRDRYISSLKKKCQREQEQNQEKQQRIETLEKYLADLPSLDEVHTQAQQLEEVQTNAQTLQGTVAQLERSVEESRTHLQEKDTLIERQAKREKELMAAVQSLQEKVEKCLEDGVRLPMLDLKQLEQENTRLLEQQSHSSTLIDGQKQQIDRLTLELTALEKRLQKDKAITQELHKQLEEREEDLKALSKSVQQKQQQQQQHQHQQHHVDNRAVLPEAASLLKEMSLCLLDLKALCSILTQRAQGKEPNLALLLGIKSMSCSSEENDPPLVEDGLQAKLLQARRLRDDIDELRTIISDRYAQDMGDNCVTQ